MATFISRLHGRRSALPPIARSFRLRPINDPDVIIEAPEIQELQAISGFVCIVEYEEERRLITCCRFDTIGENGYVGAICHMASGYRQFRCDRIETVYDASTGEVLGDGAYFARFSVDGHRDRAPTWGLTPGRKRTLVCGLNVLAFMARCDGLWHPLEVDPLERFVCSLWLQKEWEGQPPLKEIVAHAQRLSPDSGTFFKALEHYRSSSSSRRVLMRAVSDLIDADGVIKLEENTWAHELLDYLEECA